MLAGNETSLIASSPSINLPDEVSKRMEPIIASGEFSLVNVVDFASEVWSESKSQQNPWSNLLIELVSQSAANQAISELEPLNRLFDPDQLLGVEANSSRFFGRVIQKTEDANLRATFISSTLRGLKSVEGVSAFIHELDEETLPWHLSMFRSVLDKSDNIWEFLLSSVDNNDGLLRPTAIAEYVGCALLISPELMVPSSFWQRLLDRHLSEGIQQQDILGLLRLFLLEDNLHERLDWQPETLDVLVSLIPESDYELAGPMLEIPPSFSPAVYKKAASDLAEGSKTGKLPEVIPKLTDRLGLVQGEGLGHSLEFISLLASNIRQGSNSQFDPLIDQALHRIKTSETELLLGGKLETIAGELERYFGRDAQWLVWFKQMTSLLKRQEFTSLSLELSQIVERGPSWDDAVRQGTSLWLEKGVKNTGEAEGLLKRWFSTMIDAEKFEEIQNVIPPIVRSFVQPGENNEITDTFLSLVKNAWGDIHELTKGFDNGPGYWASQQPGIIQYVTQSDLRKALFDMVCYLNQQGNENSPLEKITTSVLNELERSPPPHEPLSDLGKSRYTEISNAAIATLILHEARSVLEDKSNGILLNFKSSFSRGIKNAWNPNYVEFSREINIMVRGKKKPEPTLNDLYEWWF